jgi:hypothetical protein
VEKGFDAVDVGSEVTESKDGVGVDERRAELDGF